MNARLKSGLLIALRFGLSAVLLAVAVLMIDFSDRTVFHLKSGERVEAFSWSEKNGRVHAVTSKDGSKCREFDAGEVKARVEEPGLAGLLKQARLWPAILVVPAVLMIYLSQAARWRLLLRANDFEVPLGRAFRVTWSGAFFNQILPGSVGGDVAKALIVAHGESRKAAAIGTVILDRLVGLATVVFIAGLAVLPVLGRAELRPVVWFIVTLMAAGLVGGLLYFNPAVRRWGPARRLKDRLPFRRAIEEVDDVLKTMHHAPRTILGAVGLSAVGQASTILGIYALAASIGGGGVPLSDFFLLEPIIFLVTALPISVGGWGVEQVAYAQLFGMAGMAANTAVTLSVLYKLSGLAVSLPGGILFAAGATRKAAVADPASQR